MCMGVSLEDEGPSWLCRLPIRERGARVKISRICVKAAAVGVVISCGAVQALLAQSSNAPQSLGRAPRLVVFITVDQMRYDYLERFASQFQGGFARLTRGGAVFTNAFQDHANTETAPGHATTLSGREPYRT